MMDEWSPILGETPIDDLSGLRNKSINTRRLLNEAEANNILPVVMKYLGTRPTRRMASFEYGWMLTLHKSMFGDVWDWAGTIRDSELNIGCPVIVIRPNLYSLSQDVAVWDGSWSRLEQAVKLHHRAVSIHPFKNGNGRWSRMLANIWLARHGEPIIDWPEPEIGGSESPIRKEYIAALGEADNHNFTSLIDLHSRFQS
jgi:Fic-DOC domain mobile mystery protein B